MKDRLEAMKAYIDILLNQKDCVIVAIDGKCTSGKTTLAAQLAEHYDCNVFHMDDFFLRPEQRTADRFAETGGNVDYERFQQEVLLPLTASLEFSYRPFDCKTFTLSDPVTVPVKRLNIIEGSYSMHPYFGNPYDLKVLLTVSPEVQQRRILERSTSLHKRFFEEWIPMENRYLDKLQILQNTDLIL